MDTRCRDDDGKPSHHRDALPGGRQPEELDLVLELQTRGLGPGPGVGKVTSSFSVTSAAGGEADLAPHEPNTLQTGHGNRTLGLEPSCGHGGRRAEGDAAPSRHRLGSDPAGQEAADQARPETGRAACRLSTAVERTSADATTGLKTRGHGDTSPAPAPLVRLLTLQTRLGRSACSRRLTAVAPLAGAAFLL